ncbi:hypothetical protein E0Z10_g608 [Xylaria hypoxylon]|uniref:Uncharacterized protein n=1 Tax=Xylaria hypoxylon TaxID=37992 RepID=A0A4Z0ZER1_9PEZI|nr:hypothetical protein E0Z10_g608 [Xylaria hypoxylon]
MGVTSQSQADKLAEQLSLNTELDLSGTVMTTSSPVAINFTPITHQGSVATGRCELDSAHTALNSSTKICRKRSTEPNKSSVEKRPRLVTDSSHPTLTKQLPITLTQTPTSLRSLKVTKPIYKVQGLISTKKDDTIPSLTLIGHISDDRRPGTQVQGFTTTIEQLTPHSTGISQLSLDPPKLVTARPGKCDHEHLSRGFAINTFSRPEVIFYSQEAIFDGTTRSENALDPHPIAKSSSRMALCSKNTHSVRASAMHVIVDSDECPLDEDITDEDMIQLLADPSGSIKENHMPPSSLQGWDYESQSAAEYDPALKRSSPASGPRETDANAARIGHVPGSWQPDASEDLLDEDVDWNAVLANSNAIQETVLVDSRPGIKVSNLVNVGMGKKRSGDVGPPLDEVGSLAAFTRPSFPKKVRDRPSVPGISSDTILRTCFRIGAMISQTAYSFNHQQNVVFELYARVTYSSRETLSRKQHFQFVDLFKDQQPYPAAILTNWRVDSQLDKDSAMFLDTQGGPRLCWCMCKPMKDSKAAVGWTYTVLKIKEVNWEQIRWAKRLICGDPEGLSTKTIAAKL